MEMPVPCSKCKKWVELNDTRKSRLNRGDMLCPNCYSNDYSAYEMIREINDIQSMLNNNDPEVKGDRRGWKKNIKELKEEVAELGFDSDDYQTLLF
jgi:hypothetical protein